MAEVIKQETSCDVSATDYTTEIRIRIRPTILYLLNDNDKAKEAADLAKEAADLAYAVASDADGEAVPQAVPSKRRRKISPAKKKSTRSRK